MVFGALIPSPTLLHDEEITVKLNIHTGESFKTNVGSPQGDSASAFLFIFYRAISLNYNKTPSESIKLTLTPPQGQSYTLKSLKPEYEHDH